MNFAESISKVSQLLSKRESPPAACVHSYGCQLNFSDGEKIKGMLAKMGYGFTELPERADLVIFNTCAVRENAEDRVFGNLGFLKHCKENNPDMIIGLCGCMAGLEHVIKKLEKSYHFVDIVFGTSALDRFPEMLHEKLSGKKKVYDTNEYNMPAEGLEQIRDSSFKASVPIMYGCNNFCTYCIVPYVRGRERSRRPEDILNEVRELVRSGYKEIMLLGQNVNSYGNDFDSESGIDFCGLLKSINAIEGDFIIRFMSSHPKDAGTKLIGAMLECEKVERHLHLPVQSGSDAILEKMNRKYTIEKYMETVDYARSRVSDFSFTTDIIVGFPNESAEDFEQTLELIKRVRYDNIYSFIYSKRSGTKAAEIADRISDEEKGERMTRLLAMQREISTESYKRFIGRKMRVLVDSKCKRDGWLTGKSSEFIIVEIEGEESFIGKFVDVEVTAAKNWAVTGKIIKE
ncbi:MAG: tRNA (N6-isopentenyl adenosine(37)-C2)-methylthiotransferase MiaB [Clostridium sp.]|nr:tRNA (N6-isopentenyl adenosine(37)-C2)-methylthiotransferase MiaB [Clostridium sp.]MCM1547586.1 tRNA (N6-isopentenyl adenosine(37)-C2)-methylthiotransferase MiaB [Ruminococcus sp.]